MEYDAHPNLNEIQRALEDVRRIRRTLDAGRQGAVLRRIFRPVFLLGFFFGPTMAAFALAMEWVLHQPDPEVFGLPKTDLLWLLGGGCLLVMAVVKLFVFRLAARREGYDFGEFLQRTYSADLLRIAIPLILLCAACSVMAAHLGAPERIAGIAVMGYGVIWLMMPLALPLPDNRVLGWFFLLAGAFGIFVLTEYPFLKLAAVFGLGFGVLMPLGHWAADSREKAAVAAGARADERED